MSTSERLIELADKMTGIAYGKSVPKRGDVDEIATALRRLAEIERLEPVAYFDEHEDRDSQLITAEEFDALSGVGLNNEQALPLIIKPPLPER